MRRQKASSITIIEQPQQCILEASELSEILGGWNCGSYSKRPILKDKCQEWDKSTCASPNSGENYCGKYHSYFKDMNVPKK